MSLPYYSEKEQECNYCGGEIYHGYEFILVEKMIFCELKCLDDWLNENRPIEYYWLSNRREDK